MPDKKITAAQGEIDLERLNRGDATINGRREDYGLEPVKSKISDIEIIIGSGQLQTEQSQPKI